MPDDRDYIRSLFDNASLSENDRKLWEEILKSAPEKNLRAVRAALEVDPKLIHDFSAIIKKKTRALAHCDENLWYEALREEQEIIRRYQH